MKLLSLFARKEHYFILEIGQGTIGGLGLAVGDDKKITITREIPPMPWGNRISWRTAIRFPNVTPLVALDSSHAYTALIGITHVREHIRDPLRSGELEDILSQSVARALPQCRKDAARELGTDELDALLVKAQVMNFKIDTHRVLNPLGFRAQRVEAVVRITFSSRSVFTLTKRVFGETTKIFFTDIADAELGALERIEKLPLNLIRIGDAGTVRFSAKHILGVYARERGNLVWRANGFQKAIAETWGVSQDVASKLYNARIENKLGEQVSRFLDRLFLPRTRSFFAEIMAMKLKGPLYIDSNFPLPFSIVGKKGSVSLKELPLSSLCDRLGFSWGISGNRISKRPLFPYLAVFFAHYYDKSDTTMNVWLTKHLSWLGSPVEKKG